MSSSQVTMKQIADECGVSMMTVSRALSLKHRDKLRPETLELVLKAVKKHGFLSNTAASRLKRNKLDSITLLIGKRAFAIKTINPDFDAHYEKISWGIVKDAVSAARKYGYDIKLEPILDDCNEVIPNLDPRLTDGVLLNGAYMHEPIIGHLRKISIPYIIMASAATDIYKTPENHIIVDMIPGISQAVKYLYNKGHRKIAFFGASRQNSSIFHAQTYEKLLKEKGIFAPGLFYKVENGMDIRRLLASCRSKLPFSAILCHNDPVADIVRKELDYLGIKVPDEIDVVGSDGNPAYQSEYNGKFSTINVPRTEMVYMAIEKLIKKIDGEEPEDIKWPLIIPAEFKE